MHHRATLPAFDRASHRRPPPETPDLATPGYVAHLATSLYNRLEANSILDPDTPAHALPVIAATIADQRVRTLLDQGATHTYVDADFLHSRLP